MRVLIIDDEPDLRRVVTICLERLGGMEVKEAESAEEGLRLARAEGPDLIILDVMMPSADGPTALAALRADPTTRGIPVVFLTAKAMPSEIERLEALGAASVITKPFDPMTLPSDLHRILARARGGA